MRTLLLIVFFGLTNLFGQSTNVSTPFKILGNSWGEKKESYAGDDLSKEVFQANDDARQFNQEVRENNRQNAYNRKMNLPLSPPPLRNVLLKNFIHIAKYGGRFPRFHYNLTLENTSNKTIRAILWEYIFIEKDKNRIAGRRIFITKKKVYPNKSQHIRDTQLKFPVDLIDATNYGKSFQDIYDEQVVIKKIEYTDGSLWIGK